MKSAITLCLVDEAKSGPFVLRGDLESAFRLVKQIGFDGIEVFAPGPEDPRWQDVSRFLAEYELDLAAVGTGAGWLRHQWTLSAPDRATREQAVAFIRGMIDVAGRMHAPIIIGSMQGRVTQESERPQVLDMLRQSLGDLSRYAMEKYGQPVLLEPLNRYESNLWNRLDDTLSWIERNELSHVQLLGDLFHMNIEEVSIAEAILGVGPRLGHLHFADSNRRAIGMGHTEMGSVMAALRSIGYSGYLSAEVFPWPNAVEAAQRTIDSFRSLT